MITWFILTGAIISLSLLPPLMNTLYIGYVVPWEVSLKLIKI
jgi:hypothetical protein